MVHRGVFGTLEANGAVEEVVVWRRPVRIPAVARCSLVRRDVDEWRRGELGQEFALGS